MSQYKLFVAGAGGIGSHFLNNIAEAICLNQIDIDNITIYDDDKIEMKNRLYTTYECSLDQIGRYKVDVLTESLKFRFDLNNKNVEIFPFHKKCDFYSDIESMMNWYDAYIFVSAVDGTSFRRDVFRFIANDSRIIRKINEKQFFWIDLRSEGSSILITRNPQNTEEIIKLEPFFDNRVVENASCQYAEDLEKNLVQYGNRIVSIIAVQYIINIFRDIPNELIFMHTFNGRGF